MFATKPSARDLLLELLEAVAGGAMSAFELADAIGAPAGRLPAALTDLEREGLVSVAMRHGRTAYRATPEGLAALGSRGLAPAGRCDTVAILFTDMVGSTALIESHGD